MSTIPPKIDAYLQQVVADGLYLSKEEALAEAVTLLREKSDAASPPDNLLPPDEWIKWFDEVTASFTGGNPHMDDSRESIYGDDGR